MEADCVASIEPVSSFEKGMLNYFDMLECLLRVARDYKFKAEDEATLTSLPKRLEFLLDLLNAKFAALVPKFLEDRQELEKVKIYQPRSVVDDDAGLMYEEDDE